MTTGLILIVVIVVAYLAAHVLFDWLGRRYLIVSGAEYLLLGILLGPEVAGILNSSVVGQFAPFMTLALGWIGALIGAQFHLPALLRIDATYYRVAFLEAVGSLTVTATACTLLLIYILGASTNEALIAGVAFGAIATASAPAGIALVAREMGRRGSLVQQLEVATAVDALVAIVTFGILLSIVHVAPTAISRAPTPTEWAVITLGIGVVGGALFHLFLGEEKNPDRLFIALGGAIVLASGAAAYLRVSPLLPTMLIGAVLVNTSKNATAIRQVLAQVERPLYYVLLLFVGAAWTAQPGWRWLLPVPVLLLARVIAKLGSARLAARLDGRLDAVGPHWGRALLGHGGLAVAIAFNYQLLAELPYRGVVFTAAIASVLLTDITSARLVLDVIGKYRRRALTVMQTALGIEAQFREREEMRAEEGKPRAADDAKEQERPDSGPAPKATLRQGDET
jgi:Kef-type K+ transport system membrane component KefB